MGHVTTYIGGVYQTYKTYEQDGVVYEVVSKSDQKRAMDFLNRHAFSTPTWAFNKDILNRINESTAVETFRGAQAGVLNNLMRPDRLRRLVEAEVRSEGDTYTLTDMMDDTRNGIWAEARAKQNTGIHRRHIHRAYIETMGNLLNEEPSGFFARSVDVSQSDIRPVVRNELEILKKDINSALASRTLNRDTKNHFEDAKARIDEILDGND